MSDKYVNQTATEILPIVDSLQSLGSSFDDEDIQKGFVSQEIIIKFKSPLEEGDELSLLSESLDIDLVRTSLLTELDATVLEDTAIIGAERWSINSVSVEEAIAQYSQNAAVAYLQPNYILSKSDIFPNDPSYDDLWGLNNTGQTGGTSDADIDAPEAGDIRTSSSNVVIGVIDTGVDYTHPDLNDNMWINPGEIPGNGLDDDNNGFVDDYHGYDFVNNDGDPFDDEGHGTHVAGTIAAEGNNGIGVTGVTWSAQIMALKFLDEFGFGSTFDAIQAIDYAVLMGADLTNNSWGGGGFSQALADAIAAAGEVGQVFVAAAGNFGLNTDIAPEYPAAYGLDNIISVAATDDDDQLAGFSNFGATSVDLGAPGVSILSTQPGNNYGFLDGTSMAAPHVTGVAALLLAENPDLTPTELKARLLETADPIPALDGVTVSGGRLNAFNALFAPDAAKIQGTKWHDLNADGIRDATEPGLTNWTIYLDDNNNAILDPDERFTLTDVNGDYSFSFLEPGTYTVAEVLQPGWEQTNPIGPQTVLVEEGETIVGIDFGNFLANPASISGSKWHDLNENGVREAGEPDLADWTIYLDENQNGVLDDGEQFTLTNAVGDYTFSGLLPGTYAVAEVLQPGWLQTSPGAISLTGDFFDEANDTLANALALGFVAGVPGTFNGEGGIGDNPAVFSPDDVDLMALQLAAGDRLSIDIDADEFGSGLDPILRVFDAAGNQVSVSDDDPAPGEPFTLDSYIDYTVPTAGTYYIGVSSYANFGYDPAVAGSGSGFSTGSYDLEIILNGGEQVGVNIVTLAPGEVVTDVDFGNFELPPSSISGQKWNDLNGDGVKDANEPGLAGWTIYLDQDNDGVLDSDELFTVTDDEGQYAFTDLPFGTYIVAELLQEGWKQTFPGFSPIGDLFDEANDVLADALAIGSPENFSGEGFIGDNPSVTSTNDVDFIEIQLAAGDRITIDIDADEFGSSLDPILRLFDGAGNEVRVSDDTPAPGEPFTLDSFIDYTATATATYYIGVSSYANFDYNPTIPGSGFGGSTGDYSIEIIRDSDTSSNSDGLAGANVVILEPGETASNVNFGNTEIFGALSGTKWNDLNGNGVQDPGEFGLAGWVIYLDQNQNNQLDDGEISTVTDANGAYSFDDLLPGTYTVAEVLEEPWRQTFPETFSEITEGFETGDFTGWETLGDTRIETAEFGTGPIEGTYQALLSSDAGVADGELEAFLDLAPGSLDAISTGDVIEGSAIQQTVTVAAGTELSFSWNFLTDEASQTFYNDLGFVSITSLDPEPLADTNSLLTFSPTPFGQETGFEAFSYTFETAGTFTIGMGVVDVNDGIVNSGLLIDNVVLTGNSTDVATPHIVTLEESQSITDLDFGNNGFNGGPGEDLLNGSPGEDLLRGGDGDDTIAGGLGNDVLFGDDGDDILRGDLNSRNPQGNIEGGDDVIHGGAGNDLIGGKSGDDQLFGDEGDDLIWGDDGDDLLRGGLGNDTLTGDDFSGGQGADTFVLAVGEGTDIIVDFEIGEDFIGLADNLTFSQLIITQQGQNTLIESAGEILAIANNVAADELIDTAGTTFITV